MERNKNLEAIVKKLDITETMRLNAIEKYEAIARDLNELGIEVEIYPQGSFAIGTVTRPYKNGRDQEYDLDFICQEIGKRKNMNPKEVKKIIEETLKKHGRTVIEDNTCWKVEYAEVTEKLGFKIDVVPAVDEDEDKKAMLVFKNVNPEYAKDAIAITCTSDFESYNWGAGNAKGYTAWFNDINKPFLDKAVNKKSIEIRCSIEEIPEIDKKSSLQRVIQILKRHRDIHFDRTNSKKTDSSVITTLVAEIAKGFNSDTSIMELLEFVILNLERSSEYLKNDYAQIEGVALIKKDRKWYLSNPVNPDNNLVSAWTNEDAKAFFDWIRILRQDLLETKVEDIDGYYAAMKNAFGNEFIDRNLESFTFIKRRPSTTITETSKPWRS